MNALVGIVYSNGHIEFGRDHNSWAFKRIDKELKSGQEDRIVVKPELAQIELRLSDGLNKKDLPWFSRIQSLLRTADTIYLQRKAESLRFRRAVHEIKGAEQQLVTLGTEAEVNAFALQNWARLRRFFAKRHDGFHFDLTLVVSAKTAEPPKDNVVEVNARMMDQEDQLPRVSFHATGSHADLQLIEWRSSVPEGEAGRFEAENADICLRIGNIVQPLTFLYEHRTEFRNRASVFSDPKLDARIQRILSRETV